MKTFSALTLLFTLLFMQLSTAQTQVIKAAAYVDVRKGQLIKPANIVVKEGTITAINPTVMPKQFTTINLEQKVILPGLMDMHTHIDLDFNGGFDDIITKESASTGAIRATMNAKKTLMAGFTTIRNVGQGHITEDLVNVAVAEASEKGWIAAPRIIAAGHMITITGGHGDLTLGFSEELIKVSPKLGIVNGPNEALAATRYQIKHGAKVIKIHATAGVLSLEDSVGAQQLSDEEMTTIVEEAQRHGIKVAAHAHGTEGIIAAINAGVNSIEHGSLIDDKAMKLMKKKNVFLVPTTGLVDNVLSSTDKMNPKTVKKAQYVLPLAQKNLTKAIKSGVKIALGTDAPLIPHGKNADELFAMVNRGMTNLQALQAATINSAELLGMDNLGEIKEGHLADIIAVDANPIKNLKTLKTVNFVMKGGIVYKQQ